MAALVAGVQYGLSSHSNFHENKSLIFVKLTDSAQRAIEDFLRNRNKTSQNPTIQFLGNEGQLSFPSTQSSHGTAGFTFSLSGNQDIEGPQGGFECIQQTGPKCLESLGALPCKMRIQANDDVYETTRHRMAVAEENNKNKCTRVIKANGPDIGRKVKVKGTGRTIPPPANNRHRESSSIPSSAGTQSSRLSSLSTSTPSSSTPSSNSTSSLSYKNSSNNSSAASTTANTTSTRTQVEKKVSDIMRRPLKERLIHLLALRPYKRPELYDRVNREGIKERERSIMTPILKQVAFMRDNTYHLQRHVWNDVQEDWPYYTEQEKTMLKRRKPQNLTPPGSSDGGSSGSGQSPNSTHPGSPPGITAPPSNLMSSKRPGYYQGNDGLPTKRPRISHYKKPETSSTGSSAAGATATTTLAPSSAASSSSIGDNGRTVNPTGVSVNNNNNNNNNSNNSNNNSNANNGETHHQHQQHHSQLQQQQQQQHQQHQLHQHHQQQQQQQQHRSGDYMTNSRSDRTTTNNNNNNSDVLLRSGSYANAKSCLTPTSDSEDNSQHHHYSNSNQSHYHSSNATSGGSNNSGNNSSNTADRGYSSSHNSNNAPHHHGGKSLTIGSGGVSNSSSNNSNNLASGGGVGNNNNNNSTSSSNSSGNGMDYNSSRSITSAAGVVNSDYNNSCNNPVEKRDDRDRDRDRDRERDREREREREQRKKDRSSGSGSSNSNSGSGSNSNSAVRTNSYNEMTNFNNAGGGGRETTPSYSSISNPTNFNSTTTTTIAATAAAAAASAVAAATAAAGTMPATTITATNASSISSCPDSPDSPKTEYPDYLTYYTKISSAEQRRRYKAEFNADYDEYRKLHAQIAEVSSRFARLEERLKREEKAGNVKKYEEIKKRIVEEYVRTKQDSEHREIKKRFHYLHDKLGYIKRLVLEYDTLISAGSNISTSSSSPAMNNFGDNKTGHHNVKSMNGDGNLYY